MGSLPRQTLAWSVQVRPYIPISGHHLSAIDDATILQIETAILEDCPVTERQLVYEVNISFGYVENIIYKHMHMLKGSACHDGFHCCSQLYRSKTGSSELKIFRPCIKTIRRTFVIDLFNITKHGFITMIRRQKLSPSDGNVMTR